MSALPVARRTRLLLIGLIGFAPVFGAATTGAQESPGRPSTDLLSQPILVGEPRAWHRMTLTVKGPEASETGDPNPFADFRFDVRFTHMESGESMVVPGFFCADGDAGESGAEGGDRWRVHFMPTRVGRWHARAAFLTGADCAVGPVPTDFPLELAEFEVVPTDKAGRDLRAHGLLRHAGGRYLEFAGTARPFLKAGPGSPENLLGYVDFDGTYDTGGHGGDAGNPKNRFLHAFEPHVRDWREGDPTWRGGRGKGLIGAINYIADKGMRSIYFITHTCDGGDGKDVWPWIGHEMHDRFDCSKLDQWEIVFGHMTQRGVAMHLLFQEQENDQALDGGELGRTRRLYFREMIARFGHHPAVIWNIGEENTNTTAQIKAFCAFLREVDAYDHPIALHTFPDKKDSVYGPLLGFPHLDIASLQVAKPGSVHTETLEWITRSAEGGRPWVVPLDEIGPANRGVDPDSRTSDSNRDAIRRHVTWGNLTAGGSGVEHYMGYENPHSDLNCEDWRSRDTVWDETRIAVEFFERHLPFTEMESADNLTPAADDFVFAKAGEIYAIYMPDGARGCRLDLSGVSGTFRVRWFNPRTGGELAVGSVDRIEGGGEVEVGTPSAGDGASGDWVALAARE